MNRSRKARKAHSRRTFFTASGGKTHFLCGLCDFCSNSSLWCFLLSSVLCCLPLAAFPATTISSSGRYRVTGAESSQNTAYTRWAEDVTVGFERLMRVAVPRVRGNAVEIVLDDSKSAAPVVAVTCGFSEGLGLRRVLTLRTVVPPDYNRMEEGLVRLIMAGLVERQRRVEQLPVVVPEFPQWLMVGLAQNLDKEMLARNRKVAALTGAEEEPISVSEVIGWTQIPEGWYSRQAACGLVTAWLLSFPDAPAKLLERLVAQQPVSMEWLALHLAGSGSGSVSGLEAQWRAWRDRQARAIQEFGGLSVDMIGQLREALVLTDATLRLQPGEVIAGRAKSPARVSLLASQKVEQIRVLEMGKAPELVEAGERFCRFYQGVAQGSRTFVLKWRLSRAEANLDHLERLTRERTAYLDAIEKERTIRNQQPDPAGPEAAVPGLEKSRIESYLDEAEKRFHKP